MEEHTSDEHGPSLEQRIFEESERGVTFSSRIAESIDHGHVPIKEGKPDVGEFIKHLIHETTTIAKEIVKEDPTYNPAWLPGYDALRSALETSPNAFKDGHITIDGKNSLIQLYQNHLDSYIGQRGQTKFQAVPIEDGKKAANNLADRTSDKYLKPLIDASKTATDVATRVGTAVNSTIQKARQWYQTHGKMEGYIPAYSGAHASH